jgi:GNAT superfamily N-acetyltransferase
MITVTQAGTREDLDALRDLVRAFVRWAMAEIAKSDNPEVFAGLESELSDLPGRYGPPSGCLAIARLNGVPAGCVAFFDRGDGVLEIKRMFVDPAARGHGIGGRMLDFLFMQARTMGHRRALLWSHHSMHAAHAVYERAGFRKVPFSAEFAGAVDGVDVCMEMTLQPIAAT